jgi:hypothetical protein
MILRLGLHQALIEAYGFRVKQMVCRLDAFPVKDFAF